MNTKDALMANRDAWERARTIYAGKAADLEAENAHLRAVLRRCRAALASIECQDERFGLYTADPILLSEAWEAITDPRTVLDAVGMTNA